MPFFWWIYLVFKEHDGSIETSYIHSKHHFTRTKPSAMHHGGPTFSEYTRNATVQRMTFYWEYDSIVSYFTNIWIIIINLTHGNREIGGKNAFQGNMHICLYQKKTSFRICTSGCGLSKLTVRSHTLLALRESFHSLTLAFPSQDDVGCIAVWFTSYLGLQLNAFFQLLFSNSFGQPTYI